MLEKRLVIENNERSKFQPTPSYLNKMSHLMVCYPNPSRVTGFFFGLNFKNTLGVIGDGGGCKTGLPGAHARCGRTTLR